MKISISLPDDVVAQIDRERGLVSRSAWIAAQLRSGRNPEPTTVKEVFREALRPHPDEAAMPKSYPVSRADAFRRATQR